MHQRRELVFSKHLCWNCLGDSHQVKACKSDYTCRICHQRHHTLFHAPVHTPNSTVAMAIQNNDGMVFLETALLYIVDGKRHEARALLDSGSMSNFVPSSEASLDDSQQGQRVRGRYRKCVTTDERFDRCNRRIKEQHLCISAGVAHLELSLYENTNGSN